MLNRAIQHALTNPVERLPRMAAIIADGKRVVPVGLNSRRSHPLAARYSGNPERICVHAELDALVKAREPVTGMKIYVARVLKNGQPALAKPCEGCLRALAAFGIGEIEWTN